MRAGGKGEAACALTEGRLGSPKAGGWPPNLVRAPLRGAPTGGQTIEETGYNRTRAPHLERGQPGVLGDANFQAQLGCHARRGVQGLPPCGTVHSDVHVAFAQSSCYWGSGPRPLRCNSRSSLGGSWRDLSRFGIVQCSAKPKHREPTRSALQRPLWPGTSFSAPEPATRSFPAHSLAASAWSERVRGAGVALLRPRFAGCPLGGMRRLGADRAAYCFRFLGLRLGWMGRPSSAVSAAGASPSRSSAATR